jgi:hypothetical protein
MSEPKELSTTDLMILRGLLQKTGWGEFMRHIGSLMAEQVDKSNRETGDKLFECSRTIHALNPFFAECGRFLYTNHGELLSDEDMATIRKYAGVE